MAPRFSIDRADLERAYLGLHAIIHPDRFASAGDAERRASMQWTTRVNEAYRTLRSPVQRARYLLELNGVDAAFETDTAMPTEFLAQQLELREGLEQAIADRQTDSLVRIQIGLAKQKSALETQVAESIDRNRNFMQASQLTRKLMFLEKLGVEIDAAFETLEA